MNFQEELGFPLALHNLGLEEGRDRGRSVGGGGGAPLREVWARGEGGMEAAMAVRGGWCAVDGWPPRRARKRGAWRSWRGQSGRLREGS
jgi:hypothetical protein